MQGREQTKKEWSWGSGKKAGSKGLIRLSLRRGLFSSTRRKDARMGGAVDKFVDGAGLKFKGNHAFII